MVNHIGRNTSGACVIVKLEHQLRKMIRFIKYYIFVVPITLFITSLISNYFKWKKGIPAKEWDLPLPLLWESSTKIKTLIDSKIVSSPCTSQINFRSNINFIIHGKCNNSDDMDVSALISFSDPQVHAYYGVSVFESIFFRLEKHYDDKRWAGQAKSATRKQPST